MTEQTQTSRELAGMAWAIVFTTVCAMVLILVLTMVGMAIINPWMRPLVPWPMTIIVGSAAFVLLTLFVWVFGDPPKTKNKNGG